VPKASVYEDNFLKFGQDNVRPAGELGAIANVSIPAGSQDSAYSELGSSSACLDAGHLSTAARFWRNGSHVAKAVAASLTESLTNLPEP